MRLAAHPTTSPTLRKEKHVIYEYFEQQAFVVDIFTFWSFKTIV
jgi:hypothetical protein